MEAKQKALVTHLVNVEGCGLRDAVEYVLGLDNEYEIIREDCPLVCEAGTREFTVFTDEEADAEWEQYLESYIEDCVIGEIPEQYRMWFDTEGFMEHLKTDGRGHSLNGWDGQEHEYEIDGETYYIYKN